MLGPSLRRRKMRYPMGLVLNCKENRVKSGTFGYQVNSDSDFFASYFNYWNKIIN